MRAGGEVGGRRGGKSGKGSKGVLTDYINRAY